MSYAAKGQYDQAIADLDQAKKLRPKDVFLELTRDHIIEAKNSGKKYVPPQVEVWEVDHD